MKRLLVVCLSLLLAHEALAWGQKGHDVTAYVAENHLTKRAAKRIAAVLEGYSPVYVSNWLDNASHTPEYAYTKTWHYLNVDEGETLESMPKNPDGDVLKAVTEIVARLKSGGLTPTEEALNLRMLIHLVGDMHCPMHAGHLSDLGGNRVSVIYFGDATNLHSVWDTALVESAHRWSYAEWQREIDRLSKEEAAEVASGEPADWMRETLELCSEVYASTPEGTKISYDYVAKYAPVIEQQFVRGGLRLARLLNEIYD
ncbi:MAG TPA: S1/P1 nuclease [Candidatus Alistipes intestinipullorum]|nr:S1/P1 nuclease [Candidatus Alistipes intestinipullorum]